MARQHRGQCAFRHAHSAPEQPSPKKVARPRQPRKDRAPGTAQDLGRFLATLALQITQQHRLAVFLGQTIHLFIEYRPKFFPDLIRNGWLIRQGAGIFQ